MNFKEFGTVTLTQDEVHLGALANGSGRLRICAFVVLNFDSGPAVN